MSQENNEKRHCLSTDWDYNTLGFTGTGRSGMEGYIAFQRKMEELERRRRRTTVMLITIPVLIVAGVLWYFLH